VWKRGRAGWVVSRKIWTCQLLHTHHLDAGILSANALCLVMEICYYKLF
jgi:hypothetical protein